MEPTVCVPRAERRVLPKPPAIDRFECQLAARVPVSAHMLSLAKLALVTPLLLVVLDRSAGPALGLGLLGLFFVLDYLDGVVARASGSDSWFGRMLDRATDYPLLLGVSVSCVDVLPIELIAAKLGLDLLVLILFALGRGSTENRVRTALSYAVVVGLLCLGKGWAPELLSAHALTAVLIINIVFTGIVALYNLDLLQKRFVADLLSALNLACGATSIWASLHGHPGMAFLLVLCGALFDGLDGAAARRWGGSRLGVYSDDVADGITFGLAPATAIGVILGGVDGAVIGGAYACCAIARLTYFTLAKASADPDYFAGVPSPSGAFVALSAVNLFADNPAIVGMLVGAACIQMVSFDTAYRHMGRAVAARRRRLLLAACSIATLIVGATLWGPRPSVAIVLAVNLAYGLFPAVSRFLAIARGYSSSPASSKMRGGSGSPSM